MFEKATQMKLRFQYRGSLSVEDLWDLSLQELDSIYKELNAKAKTLQEDSLLDKKSEADAVLELQIEIVKRIVAVKLEQKQSLLQKAKDKRRKEKLMQYLEEKQDEELRELPADELQKMIEELGDA